MFLLYAENITPRLRYILGFFGKQLFDEEIQLTSDLDKFEKTSLLKINYSKEETTDHREFYIQSTSLLFESGIKAQPIECFEMNFHKAFFQTRGDLPFDVFAASFYLLSRYEEYLPHEKDEYGRYACTNSLAYREKFLHLPLINFWLDDLRKALLRKFPGLVFRTKQFKCIISYDIDIAYAYLHKGVKRNLGGLARSMTQGRWSAVTERINVLRGKMKDPFDCYEWLDALHLYCRIKPYYFFLVARNVSKYDKNISTNQQAFYDLVQYYSGKYKIGLHPSWQSGDDIKLLKEELEWLEVVAERKIIHSRQHYIRLTLPRTFRDLISCGIDKDFSMGYGSINGFRASVCSSFLWYDLPGETATDLRLFPFCFMDANSFFEQKQSPKEAYTELIQYYQTVKKLNGLFVSTWHNNIIGTSPECKGWPEMFDLFMKETVYWDAYYNGPLE